MAKARLIADMTTTRATTKEEVISGCIVKKRQRRSTSTFARELNRTVHAVAGLPPKKEKEGKDGSNNSDNEQTRLDPYSVLDRYFCEKDDKGT
ncbi:Pyrophosphate-energized vacuolar membrane proton pump [Hordeum vulgare]|nr:Pyrophosphate-energized vacuolar membrane proton pump [Hordeum vulgare]